jgi:hypothetical protein
MLIDVAGTSSLLAVVGWTDRVKNPKAPKSPSMVTTLQGIRIRHGVLFVGEMKVPSI